jgi:hypothetical protein
LFRQLSKALYIGSLLQKLRELLLVLIVARDEVEDAFVCPECRARPGKWRRFGQGRL